MTAARRSKKKFRILVSNDDGIHAPGLAVAERIARTLSDDIWVVAPETEQSGASHSLTLTLPLRLRNAGYQRFAISGTPTDCVMMAGIHLMKDHLPDLVLSGVNRGLNVADDVTYSGTVAAAMEGAVLGIPSIALSQAVGGRDESEAIWACAEVHGPPLVKRLVDMGWAKDVLLNVNFPPLPPSKVKRVAVVGADLFLDRLQADLLRSGTRHRSARHLRRQYFGDTAALEPDRAQGTSAPIRAARWAGEGIKGEIVAGRQEKWPKARKSERRSLPARGRTNGAKTVNLV